MPRTSGNIPKIDNVAVLGLSGVSNSLAYKVHEIERHFHSPERWFGISGDQSGNDWSDSVSDAGMPTVFQAISGSAAFGGDADDEAKIFGTADSGETGEVKFDMHKILVIDASQTTPYVLRIVWGTGTMADAITAEQYSEIIVQIDPAIGEGNGVPIEIQMPRCTWGTDKVWVQAKNATDNATIEFFVGVHEYEG